MDDSVANLVLKLKDTQVVLKYWSRKMKLAAKERKNSLFDMLHDLDKNEESSFITNNKRNERDLCRNQLKQIYHAEKIYWK